MANKEEQFLGVGWSFPPTFSRGSRSLVITAADRNIKQSLDALLSTSIGERLMLFNFGSKLQDFVFRNSDSALSNEIKSTISYAILNYEPRIEIINIDVDFSRATDGYVDITVDYTIIQTNKRSNFVYPFFITEGTLLPAT